MSRVKVTEKEIEHPLEEVFEIDSNTTMVPHQETLPSDTVVYEQYDNKDTEIENQLQEVFDTAMTQFELQAGIVQIVEGKYAARNAEVAAQFLNTALTAVQTKATVKANKDKVTLKQSGGGGKTVNNNLIVDRNDLMKILGQKS